MITISKCTHARTNTHTIFSVRKMPNSPNSPIFIALIIGNVLERFKYEVPISNICDDVD